MRTYHALVILTPKRPHWKKSVVVKVPQHRIYESRHIFWRDDRVERTCRTIGVPARKRGIKILLAYVRNRIRLEKEVIHRRIKRLKLIGPALRLNAAKELAPLSLVCGKNSVEIPTGNLRIDVAPRPFGGRT